MLQQISRRDRHRLAQRRHVQRLQRGVGRYTVELTATEIEILIRLNYLHEGQEIDCAAVMATLIVTAKLNDVDPQAWLADVLARIAGIPQGRLQELLPWNWNAHVRSVAPPQAA